MKLRKTIIEKLLTNQGLWKKIEGHLNCSYSSMRRYMKENKSNGRLTTAGVLNLIREEYNLPTEQIVEA